MYLSATNLDQLLSMVMNRVLKSKIRVSPSKGPTLELGGVLLELKNPRARLGKTQSRHALFSCLGEFLWYLSGRNDLKTITYYIKAYSQYSDDHATLHGAYGPRLFKMHGIDQVKSVIELLRLRPASRRAVIQVFEAPDILVQSKDVPCTCLLQFMVRRNAVNMVVFMRSNDVYLGLPHDIFAFTMIQELIARTLGLNLGNYKHVVGSLHIYDKDVDKARKALAAADGLTSNTPMPPMPIGDPWPSLARVLEAEEAIRSGSLVDAAGLGLPDYWADIVRLLQVFHCYKDRDQQKIREVRNAMVSSAYETYIDRKTRSLKEGAHAGEMQQAPLKILR